MGERRERMGGEFCGEGGREGAKCCIQASGLSL